MTDPPSPISEADYEAILGAVLESARGRWFLSEYMRRNRQADTQLVLEAIGKLERSLRERPPASGAERLHLDLVDMANAISRTKAEIAAIKPTGGGPGQIGYATDELDSIVETTERATSDIIATIERIQEVAWTLREQGTEPTVCDLLDAQAAEAYTACSFQDLTGQRLRRVVGVLRFLEERIDTMIRIWKLAEEDAPREASNLGLERLGEVLAQAQIDDLIAIDRPIEEPESPAGRDAAPSLGTAERISLGAIPAPETGSAAIDERPSSRGVPPRPLRLSARSREAIEALSPAERLALFS